MFLGLPLSVCLLLHHVSQKGLNGETYDGWVWPKKQIIIINLFG